MNTQFIPGIELSRTFFTEVVQPILTETFPDLQYSAALIGSGSEVLGFDTEMSSDHHWGPRVMLFLSAADKNAHKQRIYDVLAKRLPYTFRGYSTHFGEENPEDNNVRLLQEISSGPAQHRVETFVLREFCKNYLGVDIEQELSPADWLTIPAQKLRTITAGEVFHDSIGELTTLREKLGYYPQDVWLYLLVCGWARIGQEEHLMPRAGYVGDELGSRIMGARLVHDLMNLCFLLERQYAPYPKWFGTAFSRLDCGGTLTPILHEVLSALTWQEREANLVKAYEFVAAKQNALGIAASVKAEVSLFHGRPFRVIDCGVLQAALMAEIKDAEVKRIAQKTVIGAVEQFSTSTDFLSEAHIHGAARVFYQ